MHKNLKRSRDIAYLRQLCCSGLDKEIVIPEFLRAVENVIPSGSNGFSGVDEALKPTYHVLGFVVSDMTELITVVMANHWTTERMMRARKWFIKHPVLFDPRVFNEKFYKDDIYFLVLRPLSQHFAMCAPIMLFGKPLGMMTLFRPTSGKPFEHLEGQRYTRLLPYLAHAMKTPKNLEIQYGENGSTGIMILDSQGRILYQSQIVKKLLDLACHPIITADAPSQKAAMMAKLAQICRNLDTIFKGGEAAPPSFCHVNGRGRFIFRAQWMDSENREQGKLIGLSIEHQEPQLLKILRALQHVPLSPVQKEVAALLAQGQSNEKIGQALHIKLTTVKDHSRKIYARLDIENREQLLPKLLATEKEKLIELNW